MNRGEIKKEVYHRQQLQQVLKTLGSQKHRSRAREKRKQKSQTNKNMPARLWGFFFPTKLCVVCVAVVYSLFALLRAEQGFRTLSVQPQVVEKGDIKKPLKAEYSSIKEKRTRNNDGNDGVSDTLRIYSCAIDFGLFSEPAGRAEAAWYLDLVQFEVVLENNISRAFLRRGSHTWK